MDSRGTGDDVADWDPADSLLSVYALSEDGDGWDALFQRYAREPQRASEPDANFGRILAAYGGVFVAGSLAWGMALDGFRPDRYDVVGAAICLAGVAVIMYTPRPA